MAESASPIRIGMFIIGAMTLCIVGILFFGTGRLFREAYSYVIYFDTDVNGLYLGAPVKLKGVEIGFVREILLAIQGLSDSAGPSERGLVSVVIELDADATRAVGAVNPPSPTVVSDLIRRGLGAQLARENPLAGDLYVSLDLCPDGKPPTMLHGPSPYPEIPVRGVALNSSLCSAPSNSSYAP